MTIQIEKTVLAVALWSAFFFWLPATSADDFVGKVTTVSVREGGRPVVTSTDNEGTTQLLYDSNRNLHLN